MATAAVASTPPQPSNTTEKTLYPLSANNLSNLVEYKPVSAEYYAIVSKVALPAGALFARIITATTAPGKRWSTVQVGRNRHIELNSALLYMNHSCVPSLEIDVSNMEVRVSRDRPLLQGDDLTFFYPSTEWEMSRPFECLCGGGDKCLKVINGTAAYDEAFLESKRYFLNQHILELLRAKKSTTAVVV